MNALAPATIVVAMEQLDSELAVLSQRRQLLQQLLATFDDVEWQTTTEPAQWVRVDRPADAAATNEQFAVVDAKPTAQHQKKRGGRQAKWDYLEVSRVIADGVEAGKTATAALVERYGVNKGMAGFLMKRCRELGYTRDERVSFVPTPIERTPFDAEAARNAAAGPSTGPVQPLGFAVRSAKPAPVAPAPKFDVDDALAALEAS